LASRAVDFAASPANTRAMNIAFIGLGVMGYPMAGHLARAGHAVTVFNRTPARAAAWVGEYGGAGAATPALAARGADAVFTCVGNDDDLRAVTLGPDGALAAMKAGALYVDHTTVSASIARELAAVRDDVLVLDAPVSGGQAGAVNGALTIMCGGTPAAFAAAEPVMAAYAKRAGLMGPAGSGQLTKMVNQIAIAGVLEGLAEAVNFALAAGLDAPAVFDVIGKGAAQSWQMDNRSATMAKGEYDFGFAVDWMRKDLGLVLDEARRLGVTLPGTALVDQFYGDVQALGGRRQDTSALLRRFRG
jgi:3-hydroxyisobutyrate dehydrogenase-like beta-hydroxyacid dehydrogenase